MPTSADRLRDTAEAADYMGVTPRLIRLMRARRELPVVRIGGRLIRYSTADLDAYIAAKREPARRGPLAAQREPAVRGPLGGE